MDDRTPPERRAAAGRLLRAVLRKARASIGWIPGSLIAALATAFADPPPPRTRTLRLRRGRFLRFLPPDGIDLVVAADVALAVILYATAAAELIGWRNAAVAAMTADHNGAVGVPYPPQLMHLAAAACSLPLLLRHRWPVATWRAAFLLLIWVSVLLAELRAPSIVAGGAVMYLLCLYSLALRSERQVSWGAWIASVVALWTIEVFRGAGTVDPGLVLGGAVVTSIPVLLGYNVRTRRQAQRDLAEQQRRNEEEQAARAVLEERSRIARELHDVVAHHMSVIAIQAEAAPLLVPDAPQPLKTQFAQIRATSLEALAEMRRILGILRDTGTRGEMAPQPGLERLDDLVTNALAGGLAVTTRVTGRPVPIPPGVGLSAYRIVQESLSNAMRHAPRSSVEIEICYQDHPAALRVRVDNTAPPGGRAVEAAEGARHGLVGMRERVAMLGGELAAGPTPGGGFAVAAILPLADR